MKYIISGTDRKGSNSLKVAKLVQELFKKKGETYEIIDLAELNMSGINGPFYGAEAAQPVQTAIQKVNDSEALYIVCPEYNGSMPGILKYFIDHWKYPESFEFRPMAFCGIGGMFGGLRPVEHLQQVMGYRNAFIYPERIFLMNVWKILQNDTLTDTVAMGLLVKQIDGFTQFCNALSEHKLDALSRKQIAAPK